MQEQVQKQINKPELPRVAIIICNYNYGQWVGDAVKSALIQDYPEKTVVVVDDCSTDNSVDKILAFAGEYAKALTSISEDEEKSIYGWKVNEVPFMFIKLKQNGGPSRARNFALKQVLPNHHLIQILDSDDIMMPNKVSKFVQKFMEYPDSIGGVYADYVIINENNVSSYESKEPYSIQRLSQDCIIHSGAMFSRMALQKVGLFCDSLRTCEDYHLHLRISNHFIYVHIPEPLTIVRVHPANSTNSVDKSVWQENYMRVKYQYMNGMLG